MYISGKKVGYFRRLRGVTQEELGQQIGVSKENISQWECERRDIPVKYYEQLISLLGKEIIDSRTSIITGEKSTVISSPIRSKINISTDNRWIGGWKKENQSSTSEKQEVDQVILLHDDWDDTLRIDLVRAFYDMERADFRAYILRHPQLADSDRVELLKVLSRG